MTISNTYVPFDWDAYDRKDHITESIIQYGGVAVRANSDPTNIIYHIHKWRMTSRMSDEPVQYGVMVSGMCTISGVEGAQPRSTDYSSVVVPLDQVDQVIETLEKTREKMLAK